METKEFASESGHWYYGDGSPCESVPLKKPASDGRTTTKPNLGHAKKTLGFAPELRLYPSVTTVWGIKNEQGLNKFLIDRALEFGYLNHHLPTLEDLIKAYSEYASKPSDRGTICHAVMEQMLRGEQVTVYDEAAIRAYEQFKAWMDSNGISPIDFEHSFCNIHLGYGGKLDFLGENKDHVRHVVDFKFVQKPRKPLDKECVQGASYVNGLCIPMHDMVFHNFLFLESTGELVECKRWDVDDLAWGFEAFKKAYDLWAMYNCYDPRVA